MTNSLHLSQLSTANRDSPCDASSDNNDIDEDDEDDEDEVEVDEVDVEDVMDSETEDENALVESDHFSKNIFSALDLQTTLDAATTTSDAITICINNAFRKYM